ncbi:MAG: STAS domain-containing protein [Candidatus Omnitrophica bacterium]|nr:STAS domain-containing protein [Candidatus Omnitrophota bacterium]MBU1127715.1 STAS domain-containing protein [Candidatus Omnitrophota bacterium]MBU1784122.1 STAS domain-containing protein [Candidatus Omnitrophota bacterium]MBU1850804.1 STAS domain-containing protein [Candidatus Omnitrophota bacterium]
MKLRREEKGDVTVCYIAGEININTVPDFKVTFNKMIKEKAGKVLLNLEEVGYIDSLGLATLLFFSRGLEDGGGQMIISDVAPKVGSIFKITKVDKVLSIFDTEEDALKHFE